MASVTPNVEVALVDGDKWTALTTFADTLAWERYAQAHDLDLLAPMHMLAFYAWRDARKSGRCPQDVGLDAFAERIASVAPADEQAADPTRPVPGAG